MLTYWSRSARDRGTNLMDRQGCYTCNDLLAEMELLRFILYLYEKIVESFYSNLLYKVTF